MHNILLDLPTQILIMDLPTAIHLMVLLSDMSEDCTLSSARVTSNIEITNHRDSARSLEIAELEFYIVGGVASFVGRVNIGKFIGQVSFTEGWNQRTVVVGRTLVGTSLAGSDIDIKKADEKAKLEG